jgi:hypothetical protein
VLPFYVRDPNATNKTQGYVALREVVQKGPTAHEIVAHEIDQALAHLSRAQAIGITLGFGDELGRLITGVTAFKATVEDEIEKLAA